MRGEIERFRRFETAERLPPLAVSRVTEHIEEDLAYRLEFTLMKGNDAAGRLSDGITKLHQDNAAKRWNDPVLGQFHHKIEATLTVAGCHGIVRYMEHLQQGEEP